MNTEKKKKEGSFYLLVVGPLGTSIILLRFSFLQEAFTVQLAMTPPISI
jgi:hypothetical protein